MENDQHFLYHLDLSKIKSVKPRKNDVKELTEKRRKKWLENLRLWLGGAESANARVYSDHFVKGKLL